MSPLSPASGDPAASEVTSSATESALELPALRRLLQHLTSTDLGRRRVAALRPIASRDELEHHRRRYEETRRLLVNFGIFYNPCFTVRHRAVPPFMKQYSFVF